MPRERRGEERSEDPWEAAGVASDSEDEAHEASRPSTVPRDMTEAEEAREAGKPTRVGGDLPEERETWGAADALPRERGGPPEEDE